MPFLRSLSTRECEAIKLEHSLERFEELCTELWTGVEGEESGFVDGGSVRVER